jgi:hypothetical protein
MSGPFPPISGYGSLRPQMGGVKRFPIFVSYGDEAKTLKARVKRIIEDAFARQLSIGGWPIELVVWDWRDMAAGRAPAGGKTNDRFLRLARESSVTIVMLLKRMPPGSAEELVEAAEDDEIDLKVFWLREGGDDSSEVALFLKAHQNDFAYVEFTDLNSEDTWVKLIANMVAVLLMALRGHDRPPYVEVRDAA